MTSSIDNINVDELQTLIRGIVKEELEKINSISNDEQLELKKLYGDSLNSSDYKKEDCIRL